MAMPQCYDALFALIVFLDALQKYNHNHLDENWEVVVEKGLLLSVHVAASALLPPPFSTFFGIAHRIFTEGYAKAAQNDIDARFDVTELILAIEKKKNSN